MVKENEQTERVLLMGDTTTEMVENEQTEIVRLEAKDANEDR